ncbi:sulfite exporter TauE/SafE family protein [Parasphingorhabdus halotolerans]|uniref:Probable membrane transporter protein n=1 Tax=Parasphingorhabdus halotolerans TaxID=2725558 RepID=A0A6H2DJG9_9SPHN|nr:sulfite exporter TauE/SafE family protein [Parasphingorhabdus halotolerans]QJB68133.1 sulfite exporter TauE/SafE family protein [Parasphingorhabdus halotolerans]
MPWLVLLFFLTAALYASVGFGGGSTYIALLALADIDYRALPIIALICNIIVVTGGTLRFHLRGLINWQRIWPILTLSVPAAWLGGRIAIDKDNFLVLLGLSLAVAAVLLWVEPLIKRTRQSVSENHWTKHSFFALAAGVGIGFLSGMVGIGGGIFLAPILLLTHWSDSRRIAATASIFILVNSVGGLAGQLMKSGWGEGNAAIIAYWPLFLGVLIGGQIGSFLASQTLPEIWIRRLTALLILYVAVRILWV